jgi:drug/metabolite transporter (DMT)-like permease
LLAAILALGSATLYGVADFLGGLAARRATTAAVVLVSQASGMIALALVLPILPDTAPTTADLVWGAVAGVAIGAGLALLYRGLAVGSMAVVAPTTAVCAVVIPLTAAVLLGERPGPGTLVGIALAILAIVLVSGGPRHGPPHPPILSSRPGGAEAFLGRAIRSQALSRSRATPAGRGAAARGLPAGLGLALLAGVGIGVFFFALARAASTAGLWPLLAARGVAVALFGMAALVGRRSLRMAAPVAGIVVAGGVIDMLANALYLLATHHGPLSVVVTLSSLYPASTVLLALAVLGERLSARQGVGIACALLAVLLIVAR